VRWQHHGSLNSGGVNVCELYLLCKRRDDGIEGEVREGLLDGNGYLTTSRISVGNKAKLV